MNNPCARSCHKKENGRQEPPEIILQNLLPFAGEHERVN
ncbi:hypothetical protein UUU_43390 [Klebsiella pneumoniae subsp. pneumoniae DSM 30104 = JCM 1662 = NBRC 14940]|nr:hypothetical protein UUU_43390 [Klebsiella pneumoniae subsp. pneumoniae DSM 30104 = JCM 1662 = NBRC 14940]